MSTTADPLEAWLNTPVPATLWHYTSLRGAQGIITNREIFATDVRCLNDREEFVHIRKLVQEFVDSIPDLCPNGWSQKTHLQVLLDHLIAGSFLSSRKTQVFVASFSTAEDQLSQWRGYSGDTTGVSLGFDLKSFRLPAARLSAVTFAPCVYADVDKKRLIAHAMGKFIESGSALWKEAGDPVFLSETIQKLMEQNPHLSFDEAAEQVKQTTTEWQKQETHRVATVLAFDLFRLAALLKDSSFSEEQEWRLVLPVMSGSTPTVYPIHYRTGSTSLIPYIKFPLMPGRKDPVPLKAVILGPGSDTQTGVDSMRGFLASESIGLIPKESDVPFRPR
ncbi:MAG TPA: DUF2971 domain-containing protein [Acidobacteriaceae bacterium]|jgi:hypothetical protein